MYKKSDNNKAKNKSITYFGNSLTAGTGAVFGESLVYWMRAIMPDRLHYVQAIGGQNSDQILARQGSIPIKVTLPGGAIPTGSPVSITPSINFLSAPGDVSVREFAGEVNFVRGTESFNGTVPLLIYRNASDVYTAIALGKPFSGTIAANSVFIPYSGSNARGDIQVLWGLRNDSVKTPQQAIDKYNRAIEYMYSPRRAVVLGELTLKTETGGQNPTAGYNTIITLNNALRAEFGDRYVEMTPPTVAECSEVGYTLTSNDDADIALGIWPIGMRADSTDTIHLNGIGYRIVALRIYKKLLQLRF